MAKPADKRKSSLEKGVEDFGEEVEALGKKFGERIEEQGKKLEARLAEGEKRESENAGAKRLYRSASERVLGGVCGGIAEYFNIDPIIVRLLWVLLALSVVGIFLYIIAWIIIPRNPEEKWD